MKLKEQPLLPLFEKFIQDSNKGRRLKADGNLIKPQTIRNYRFVLRYLQEYEQNFKIVLRVRIFTGSNKRIFLAEKKYWKTFYTNFTNFLYNNKKCFDNYVGTVIKIIKMFFNYMNKDLGIITGDFYKSFYVCREEIPIITLLPEQLQFLINNKAFSEGLSGPLQKSKDIFVFGCTVALRISDLFSIKFSDIEQLGQAYYLSVKTKKTGKMLRIKLPEYAIQIIEKFKKTANGRKTIFPPMAAARFNIHLKLMAESAGWSKELGKCRSKRGVAFVSTHGTDKSPYRFCDLISSHSMRRTAITTMLMLGMKEHVVKQISGHSNDSKSFYRYVNLVQSYIDNEVDEVFNKLVQSF
jgi:integrase